MAKRAQFFTFELYPESAPRDWLDILKDWHIPMYLSTHDKDVEIDKATGEVKPKKVHVHILVMFDSMKGIDCLDELIEAVNGVKPPLHKYIVANKRSMARYLAHMDEDPEEKYPYYLDSNHKVIEIGGIEPYNELCKGAAETKKAEMNATIDIQDFCEKKGISNVATFLRVCRATEHKEWIEIIQKYSYFWGMWFRSFHTEDPIQKGKAEKILRKAMKGEQYNESDDRRNGD